MQTHRPHKPDMSLAHLATSVKAANARTFDPSAGESLALDLSPRPVDVLPLVLPNAAFSDR